MKLEYRVLELAKGDEQECHYCFVDYDDPTNLNFDTAPATHEMVALEENKPYVNLRKVHNWPALYVIVNRITKMLANYEPYIGLRKVYFPDEGV